MTTATTNTVLDHTSDAAFRVWVQEIITMLVTTLGVTQTGDTGQINTSTVTRPGTSTAGGYVILRFNDTAQSTTPIFIKLEFGTGAAAAAPKMWITVGSASNGTGTITGVVMTRVSVTMDNTTPNSTSTPYVTRGCYNATAGFLGFVWKNGSGGTAANHGGFFIFRSADSTGAVTTDAFMLITNSSTATGITGSQGYMQVISNLTGVAYTASPWPSNTCTHMPFGLFVTLYSSNGQVGPIFQFTPVLGITPWCALALVSEIAIGSTVTMTLIGATSHTFISVGGAFGNGSHFFQAYSVSPGTNGAITVMMLWE